MSGLQELMRRHGNDRARLIDMLLEIQREAGYVDDQAIQRLAEGLNLSPLEVRETISFYHFIHDRPPGRHTIWLADTVIARMNGYKEVRKALEEACGCVFGQVDASGSFGLFDTNCIGLSDQEPAMMVDDVVFTRLTPERVRRIVTGLRAGRSAQSLAAVKDRDPTDSDFAAQLASSAIRQRGPVFFSPDRDYPALVEKLVTLLPEELIARVVDSGLRGRGGAGFPTGLKWRLGREAEGAEKYVICNADEGEPGTFKDRVLLMESPEDVLLGMIMAGWALGARHGILYLRWEYGYLQARLQRLLEEWQQARLLGADILGQGFAFDIRIQKGAGAYVCGDETALIESCEGKRGTPRVKPPYPIEEGYLGMPTCVNNVETLAAASRILEKGASWFRALGAPESTGTRLLSVSGDCDRPGIYEIEWGVSLNKVLRMVGAVDPLAVQVSGPSGECVSVARDGERVFCYSDLSCNGSLMIFDRKRDLLEVVEEFTRFFVDESCGICVPCRAGGVDLLHKIRLVRAGRATRRDLDDIRQWGALMHATSRCGLGTTAAKPLLTTLDRFPERYEALLAPDEGPLLPSFDREAALEAHRHAHRILTEDASS